MLETFQNIPLGIAGNFLFFHAFTGCDAVSAFCGIGKRSAWKACINFRPVEAAFTDITTPDVIHDKTMKNME
jgi:hypothetical protein